MIPFSSRRRRLARAALPGGRVRPSQERQGKTLAPGRQAKDVIRRLEKANAVYRAVGASSHRICLGEHTRQMEYGVGADGMWHLARYSQSRVPCLGGLADKTIEWTPWRQLILEPYTGAAYRGKNPKVASRGRLRTALGWGSVLRLARRAIMLC